MQQSCNNACPQVWIEYGKSEVDCALPALSMMIEELHSGGIVTKPAMCSCLELCVLGFPSTQCRVLGVAGIGIVELAIHSVPCAWYGVMQVSGYKAMQTSTRLETAKTD